MNELRVIPSSWALVVMVGGGRVVLGPGVIDALLSAILEWRHRHGAPARVGRWEIVENGDGPGV